MKILIWCICLFSAGFLIQLLKTHGVLLGAIPIFIMYSCAFWLIHVLCKKWDEYREVKNNESDSSRKQL